MFWIYILTQLTERSFVCPNIWGELPRKSYCAAKRKNPHSKKQAQPIYKNRVKNAWGNKVTLKPPKLDVAITQKKMTVDYWAKFVYMYIIKHRLKWIHIWRLVFGCNCVLRPIPVIIVCMFGCWTRYEHRYI